MQRFSKKSIERLNTCHSDLQKIMNTVIQYYDCTILCGHRGKEEQDKAFKERKSQLKYPYSNHNKMPSIAIDVCPYPLDWNDICSFKYMGGYILGIADLLYTKGEVDHKLSWGGNWNTFKDYPHFELTDYKD